MAGDGSYRIIATGDSDLDAVHARLLHPLLWVNDPVVNNGCNISGARDFARALLPNGAWPDVNYTDRTRTGAWQPERHLRRQLAMAISARQTYETHNRTDVALVAAVHRSLSFWFQGDAPNGTENTQAGSADPAEAKGLAQMQQARGGRGRGPRVVALEAEVARLQAENRTLVAELNQERDDQRQVWLMLQGLVRKTEEQHEELMLCKAELADAHAAQAEEGGQIKPEEEPQPEPQQPEPQQPEPQQSEQLLEAHRSEGRPLNQRSRLELVEGLAAVCNRIERLHCAQQEQQELQAQQEQPDFSNPSTPGRVFTPRTPRGSDDVVSGKGTPWSTPRRSGRSRSSDRR
eukprot:COSAG05_NODE_827_length_7101_cov_4.580834_3_plen_347_part_00